MKTALFLMSVLHGNYFSQKRGWRWHIINIPVCRASSFAHNWHWKKDFICPTRNITQPHPHMNLRHWSCLFILQKLKLFAPLFQFRQLIQLLRLQIIVLNFFQRFSKPNLRNKNNFTESKYWKISQAYRNCIQSKDCYFNLIQIWI